VSYPYHKTTIKSHSLGITDFHQIWWEGGGWFQQKTCNISAMMHNRSNGAVDY